MNFELTDHDLDDAERVVKSDKFSQFLMNNTTSWLAAAFILQTLLDRIDEVREMMTDE